MWFWAVCGKTWQSEGKYGKNLLSKMVVLDLTLRHVLLGALENKHICGKSLIVSYLDLAANSHTDCCCHPPTNQKTSLANATLFSYSLGNKNNTCLLFCCQRTCTNHLKTTDGGAVVSADASHWIRTCELGAFSVRSRALPVPAWGFLQVLWFPPTVRGEEN